VLDAMLRNGVNSPRASSCGRLFDAVAAALDVCRERQAYEGEAACRLEAIAAEAAPGDRDEAPYPFSIAECGRRGLTSIDARPMWQALLGDLAARRPAPLVAARFHAGLAAAIVTAARMLAREDSPRRLRFDTVALSGGCFQNPILLGAVMGGLEAAGFVVLSHSRVPANDGGLALGQAAIAAARLLSHDAEGEVGRCASESPAAS
jgi:hydrogenase maturation protein HypF